MIRNVIQYLENSSEKYPDKIIACDVSRQLTYKELNNQAKSLATELIRILGEGKNKPIAVYMKKSVNCIVAFMAIAYSGNFYSPIDISSPKERINTIIKILQPSCIITDCSGKRLTEDLQTDAPFVLLEDFIKKGYDDIKLKELASRRLDIDPLYVLFTSGSTGLPKGVTISQAGVIDYTEWLHDIFGFDETVIFGEQAPFHFDNSVLDIYSTIRNGATMVIIPEEYFTFHMKLFSFMAEHKVNTIFWVPSALAGVANSGILDKMWLSELKKVLFCGEVMPTKQFNIWRQHYPDVLYANLYGPTEITDVCAYYIIDRNFENNESIPIGHACANTEIMVLNEVDKPVENDEIGELCVRGIGNSLGYYGLFEKTDNAFVQNPLNGNYYDKIYRTGDLVKYNNYGELIYVCRKDFQIKHQGHRIELGEIEAAVNSIVGIMQCCALYDENKKRIVLFCSTDGNLREKDIYVDIKLKIPKYMLPGKIIIRQELPLNMNGKIDRVALAGELKEI